MESKDIYQCIVFLIYFNAVKLSNFVRVIHNYDDYNRKKGNCTINTHVYCVVTEF